MCVNHLCLSAHRLHSIPIVRRLAVFSNMRAVVQIGRRMVVAAAGIISIITTGWSTDVAVAAIMPLTHIIHRAGVIGGHPTDGQSRAILTCLCEIKAP